MDKVRVQLVADFGPKKGHVASSIVVLPEYEVGSATKKGKGRDFSPKKGHVASSIVVSFRSMR